MQLRFCADTLLCRHIFMQLRIYTAYAAMFLCSYASIPLMRPLFCAVLSCGRAFALSCFSMRTKPLHGHAFTQLNPLRRHILMQLRFLCSHAFTLDWMEMVLRGTDLRAEVGSLGDGPVPVRRYGSVVPAGPLLSRQAEGDGTPAVFSTDGVHGALQLLLLFLLPGDHRGLQ